jgi:glycine cleavage system H protein
MNTPNDLFYTKEHEWARIEGNTATVGITEFAVGQLGDITLVELPDVGAQLSAGDTAGTIESVKAVSDLYTPLGGTETEINGELDDAPELVNEDPYGKGWMFRIEIPNKDSVKELMDAEAYTSFLATLDE